MTTTGVSATSSNLAMERQQGPPRTAPTSITRDELEQMKSRLSQEGKALPEGLDTLIEKFDAAAGEGGSMSMAQFKAFAKENGVTIPEPPSRPTGGQGAPPRAASAARSSQSGPGGSAAAGRSATAASSASSSSEDVSSMAESELKTAAAEGDLAAIRELDRRAAVEAARAEGRGSNVDEFV